MKRRRADAAAGLLLGAVLLVGGAFAWQRSRQRHATDGSMGSMMDGTMHGPDPLWFVLGTVSIAVVLGAAYLLVRPAITTERTDQSSVDAAPSTEREGNATEPNPAGDGTPRSVSDPDTADASATPSPSEPDDSPSTTADIESDAPEGAAPPEANPTERVLELLPEDERRILEPVRSSPGITQVALRDRSSFSKSKVSQTVSDLEERGLLYRERQGRTYRIYPSDELAGDDA